MQIGSKESIQKNQRKKIPYRRARDQCVYIDELDVSKSIFTNWVLRSPYGRVGCKEVPIDELGARESVKRSWMLETPYRPGWPYRQVGYFRVHMDELETGVFIQTGTMTKGVHISTHKEVRDFILTIWKPSNAGYEFMWIGRGMPIWFRAFHL